MSSFQGGAYTIATGYNALSDLAPEIRSRAPTSSDTGFPIGKIWVDKVANIAYTLTSFSPATNGTQQANWNVSAITGVLSTLTGDSGGAISAVANNIDILGTAAQIVTTGSAGTITFSIADPFNIPGDVVIPGTLSVTGLTTLGALTEVGTASINATGAATTTIGSAAAGAISIDTTAGVTINADEASSFTVTDAGVDLTLSSTLGSVNITAGQSAADSIVISSAIGGIDITAAGAAAGEDIDITATGSSINLVSTEAAVANAIRLNASAADGGIDIDCGTGGITIDSTGTFSIDGAAASNMTVTGAGLDLTVASVGGSVVVSSNEAVATAIGLTASDAAGGITFTAGTGNINMTANSAIQSKSVAGVDMTYEITNSDNTSGTSRAGLELATGGASSGDPYINFLVSGAGVYTMGIDNSASDNFVLAASAALGTTDIVTISLAGALTTAAGITSTAGNIQASNGNLVLNTAGNKIVSTSVGSGTAAGANSFGTVTLTGGTATVSTTAVTASSIIYLTRQSPGATGAAALGNLSIGTITASTSFVVNALQNVDATALQASDVSVVGWVIVN